MMPVRGNIAPAHLLFKTYDYEKTFCMSYVYAQLHYIFVSYVCYSDLI